MNEAEKMAQELEDGPWYASPREAAALIREQEAKIKRMAEALDYLYVNSLHARQIIQERFADALRDAGVKS